MVRKIAKYTTELWNVCASLIGYEDYEDYKIIIEKSRPLIFDFDYPIFDVDYKTTLETKILKHFYMCEIGFETYGQFKLKLDSKMNEIMPYYNKLYESELLKIEPLETYNIKKEIVSNKESENTTDKNSTTNTNKIESLQETNETDVLNKNLDTPQSLVSNLDDGYLTQAEKNKTEQSKDSLATTNSETHNNDNIKELNESTHRENVSTAGVNGFDKSQLLLKYRETFLNIDMQIIEELETLFFKLW